MMKYILFILLIVFSGCGSEIVYRDTYIRDTLVKVNPVIYNDTVTLKGDTVVKYAYRFHKKDTVLKIKYYPGTDRMIIQYKNDTTYVPVKMPQIVYREPKEQGSTFDKLLYVFVGLIPFIILIIYKLKN